MEGGRKYRTKIDTTREFPMRGFLLCPECNRLLTGSKSKGRNRYYAYYHCVGGCIHRTNAEKVNNAIKAGLLRFVPKIQSKALYKEIITKAYFERTHEAQSEKKDILNKIKDYDNRLSHVRDLLATQQIDASDYRQMKTDYGAKISTLELQLTKLNSENENIEALVELGLTKIIEIENALREDNIMGCEKKLVRFILKKSFLMEQKFEPQDVMSL